jgi:predicted metalloprotease with PDZ domain
VVLRYPVYGENPLSRADATFLDGARAVLVGRDVFVIPAGLDQAAPADITVDLRVAGGWPVWSTWGTGDSGLRPSTFEDLVNGFAAAGDFAERSLESGDARAVILVEGRGNGRTGLTVANRLLPVLRETVDLFGASPRGGRFEVLAVYRFHPRNDRRSTMFGVRKNRGFLCLASPDRYEDLRDITALAAHECLHAWLGGALRVAAEPPHANAPELIWFLEGLTEYLSWRLLRDAGVIDAAVYAEVAAAKREKAAAVGPGLRLADAAERMADVRIYELVYTRGFLVAELLQSRMDESCGPGAFDEALRDLFRSHNTHETGTWLSAEVVREAFGGHCPAAREVILEEAERGRDLPPSTLFTSRGK